MRERLHAERTAGFNLLVLTAANRAMEQFGKDGEMAYRRWIRKWATWRGGEMRQAHQAMGLQANMETLNLYWDSSSVSWIIKDEVQKGRLTPYDVRYYDAECSGANLWRAEGAWDVGVIYCDENHQHIAQSYHPDAVVVMPVNMMKGDDRCLFCWLMPPGAEEIGAEPTVLGKKLALNHQRPDDPYEEFRLALKRPCRLVGRWIAVVGGDMIETFGPEGEEWWRQTLRAYAKERGRRQFTDHVHKGLSPTPANLIRKNDVPYQFVWEIEEKEATDTQYAADVHYCPYQEVWRDNGEEEIGQIYCEEVYPALCAGYSEVLGLGIKCEIPQKMSKGDPVCAFRMRM
jgi:hypothetical protein